MHSKGSLLSTKAMPGINPLAIFLRRFFATLIVIVFALQTGCATQIQRPIPNTPNQDSLGKVAVVTTSDAPVIDIEEMSQLKGAGLGTAGGAAMGAAAGAAICAPYVVLAIICPLCAPAAVGAFGTCVGIGATAGAAVGGVAGATTGATAEEAEKMQAKTVSISETFKAKSIQQLLRDRVEAKLVAYDAKRVLVLPENLQEAPAEQATPAGKIESPKTAHAADVYDANRAWVPVENQQVVAAGNNYRPWTSAESDPSRSPYGTIPEWQSVPEPAEKRRVIPAVNHYHPYAALGADKVLEVAFTEVGLKGGRVAMLTMKADVRIVDTSNGEELFTSHYTWQGQKLKSDEWATIGVEGMLKEVQRGYQAMATHIHENIFLLFPFPDRKLKAGFYGLLLRSPRPKMGIISSRPIDSLQPTFSWQSFPRASDIKRVPEQMSRVKDVRYDLVIAARKNGFPGEIIYRREGLANNSHTLETVLSPGEHYYWTVRARFELDSRQQLTEWSQSGIYKVNTVNAPNQGSFQFITPKKKAEQE